MTPPPDRKITIAGRSIWYRILKGLREEAQATESIEISLTGEDISIAFNPVFLADGLNAVGTPYVQISFTGSNKPAILMGRTTKDGAAIENYRYLLMPMRYAS